LKLSEVITNHESIRFDVAVESLLRENPRLHQIEFKVIYSGSGKDTVLAVPRLLTVEGQPALIQIGSDGDYSLSVDVVVEPVK
jgi:hypothetical protein